MELTKGQVIWVKDTTKVRPAVVINVFPDRTITVVACTSNLQKDYPWMLPIRACEATGLKKDGYINCREFAVIPLSYVKSTAGRITDVDLEQIIGLMAKY